MNYPFRLFHPLAVVVVALIAMTSPARPIAQTGLPVIISELDNPYISRLGSTAGAGEVVRVER